MSSTSDSLQAEQATQPLAQKRLCRSRTEKILGGVCGGLGDYFAIDPMWFRIGFVVLALGGGSGILIYLLMCLIVPEQPEGYEPVPGARTSVNGGCRDRNRPHVRRDGRPGEHHGALVGAVLLADDPRGRRSRPRDGRYQS